MKRPFSDRNENLQALFFCLMLIALVVLTAELGPSWIYSGF